MFAYLTNLRSLVKTKQYHYHINMNKQSFYANIVKKAK